jgi:hypothetical protein
MVEYLFPRFLDDTREYARAEAYWHRLWDEIVPLAWAWEWKQPWLKTSYADGTPFCDGDPIFSAWSPSSKLAVRVIQNRPQGQNPALDFWTDTVGDEWTGEVIALVISCTLSRQTADLARRLIFSWVRYGEASISHPPVGPNIVMAQLKEHVFRAPHSARQKAPVLLAIPA